MESAYIYVRVSTDEQKRKGYSLIEQEERLLHHCEINHIKVKGIFREDFSAKDFNRPEWKRLIQIIKKNKQRPPENILFLKWDRFSRNIAFAYQMIDILNELNVQAMAIDQPVDFEIPESIVMLAVYLSIPEAENTRRGRNTSDGLRRAKKLGRWPGRPPIGYINQTDLDGKRYTVPKQPESDHIRWSFQQYAKGVYSVSQVKRMASLNGFECSRNNFWKLLRNPFYCGIITVSATKTEECQLVEAAHDPIIPKFLFEEVQKLIKSRRKQTSVRESLKHLFPLRGFLKCPWCNRTLTGSFSAGRKKKYRYYHCNSNGCKGRFRSDILEASYEEKLSKIYLAPEVYPLFEFVLQDENILSTQSDYKEERKSLLADIDTNQYLLSKARKLLLTEQIGNDDFTELKTEYKETISSLNNRLNDINERLDCSFRNTNIHTLAAKFNLVQYYRDQDIAGKRHLINLFSPNTINPFTKQIGPLEVAEVISKIVRMS